MGTADTAELNDIVNFLRGTGCFTSIDRPLVEQAAVKLRIGYYRSKASIPEAELGEYLWIVRTGAVEILTENNTLLGHIGEGDFFGSRNTVSHHHSCDRAVMMEDTLLYKLPVDAYNSLCKLSVQFRRLCKDEFDHDVHSLVETRSDTLALTHRLRDLVSRKVIACNLGTRVCDAAALMSEHKISSLPVTDNGVLMGIVTDRDLRSRVVAKCGDYKQPIENVMTANPLTVDINSFTFEALMTMSQHNVHHLPVMEADKLVGLVTVTDLIRQQRSQPVFLIGEVWKAADPEQLAEICQHLPKLFVKLVEADARAGEISRILTAIADATAQRLLHLFRKQHGAAPVPFTWLAFGSQGREELSISSDQDNALLLDDKYNPESHGDYFENLATYVCGGLAACGFRYCPGDIMATTEQWRQPLSQWKKQFGRWINEPEEKAVMFSSIFFDIRAISGDRGLFHELQNDILMQAGKNRIFLAHMARNALTHRPPLGLFRGLVLESSGEHKDQLDLKHKGTIPVTDIARQHALAHGIKAVNTLDRLQALAGAGHINKKDVASLVDAHEFLAQLRFSDQAEEIRQGKPGDNFIDPGKLSPLEKNHLKSAFKLIKANQEAMAADYLGNSVR